MGFGEKKEEAKRERERERVFPGWRRVCVLG